LGAGAQGRTPGLCDGVVLRRSHAVTSGHGQGARGGHQRGRPPESRCRHRGGFSTSTSCASLVAVGIALTSGPPHRSVREGLPHTALTSVHLTAAARWDTDAIPSCSLSYAPQTLCSHLRLWVRYECACGAFPLVALLPSADSAANAPAPACFARFVGTMRPSDSLQTCMSTLRLLAFFDRPTLLSS